MDNHKKDIRNLENDEISKLIGNLGKDQADANELIEDFSLGDDTFERFDRLELSDQLKAKVTSAVEKELRLRANHRKFGYFVRKVAKMAAVIMLVLAVGFSVIHHLEQNRETLRENQTTASVTPARTTDVDILADEVALWSVAMSMDDETVETDIDEMMVAEMVDLFDTDEIEIDSLFGLMATNQPQST